MQPAGEATGDQILAPAAINAMMAFATPFSASTR